jgi:F-type H+-transporting ATPase subunit gamma
MATPREIKRRIKSVQDIAQLTHSLEAVAASRVPRAQARVLASRPYAMRAWSMLVDVASQAREGALPHPLLDVREPVSTICVIVISSDRGLAGPYNTNILRTTARFVERKGKPAVYITVGRKGCDFLIRRDARVQAEFSHLPDDPSIADIAPIARTAMDDFLTGETDEVYVAYTDFINMLAHRPVVLRLLPLKPYDTEDMVMAESVKEAPEPTSHGLEWIYEPSAADVLDLVLPRFIQLLVYQAVLEAQACEHSARMVAMGTASENAEELVGDLTLSYHKARQLAVTSEMLDIAGGAEALSAAR